MQITCGTYYTLIRSYSDLLYSYGADVFNCRSQGDLLSKEKALFDLSLTFDNVTDVSSGDYHFLYISDGNVYGRGCNDHGQLGFTLNYENASSFFSKKIEIKNPISVHCRYNSSFILTKNGLFGSGNNFFGSLGLGDRKSKTVFTKINIPVIKLLKPGHNHTFAITVEGLFGTGCNRTFGQLGLGCHSNKKVFTKIPLNNVIDIECGLSSSSALTTEGLFCCGSNTNGQLGIPNTNKEGIRTFQKIIFKSEILSVSCGEAHTIILTKDGVYGCGTNNHGQLGLVGFEERYEFTKINLSNIISIVCEDSKSFFLTKEGLYECGVNIKLYEKKDTKPIKKIRCFDQLFKDE
jgi:alpha-tubulin suppressor-like RCC1 family protein